MNTSRSWSVTACELSYGELPNLENSRFYGKILKALNFITSVEAAARGPATVNCAGFLRVE